MRLYTLCVVVACLGGLLALPNPVQADADIEPDSEAAVIGRPRGISITTGFERRFEADIDDGGSLEEWRVPIGVSLDTNLSRQWHLGVGVNYIYNKYDFSGTTGFGGLDPWGNIHIITVSVPVMYRASQRWQFIVAPTFQFSAESGADFGDAFQGGGTVAALYTLGKRLMLGLGVGAITQIEDDPSYRIFPVIRWQVTNRLVLETRRNLLRGGGVGLTYSMSTAWQVNLGVSTNKDRFRLDDDDIAPDGVGERSSVPMWASIAYTPSAAFNLELYGGVAVDGQVRLEDEDGDRISKEDVDPAPFLGLLINGSF